MVSGIPRRLTIQHNTVTVQRTSNRIIFTLFLTHMAVGTGFKVGDPIGILVGAEDGFSIVLT